MPSGNIRAQNAQSDAITWVNVGIGRSEKDGLIQTTDSIKQRVPVGMEFPRHGLLPIFPYSSRINDISSFLSSPVVHPGWYNVEAITLRPKNQNLICLYYYK